MAIAKWQIAGGLVLWLAGAAARLPADEVGLRAPAGFRVELFAGDDLAHDIFSMTLDAQGRVVVAGRDYVKTLHDDNGDGRADRATLFSPLPASGAHGMLFIGNNLLCTGDNSLLLLRDQNGDGQADGPPERWAALRHPEHGANGIVRGPDGWIYVICGNDAGVTAALASTPSSPVKRPISGAVVRFDPSALARQPEGGDSAGEKPTTGPSAEPAKAPAGTLSAAAEEPPGVDRLPLATVRSEIVAHGFRNPYDLDFNAAGQMFTVDADGERDHHLPWYAPTRLFDIAPGMHHGWVLNGWQRSWNRPAYFPDNVERLVEIGRGSPTGLVVYRHQQFPQRYRGSVLSCCWTLGRVYHFPLAPAGSSYTSPKLPEVFLETTGEIGFAPVDLAVGRAGELYIAIGGRRTRGSVFRVTYEGGAAPPAASGDRLAAVLQAPQPLAAWSRAGWEPLARELGRDKLVAAAAEGKRPLGERLRAVEIVTELFGGLGVDEAGQIMSGARPELVARVLWSLARQPRDADALKLVVAGTHDARPVVQRAAFEALGAWTDLNGSLETIVGSANWAGGFVSRDRRVQAAALLADARRAAPVPGQTLVDLWRRYYRGELGAVDLDAAAEAFLSARGDRERLSAVRLMELALGDINTQPMSSDVYAGYTLSAPREAIERAADRWGAKLAAAFPGREGPLNLELARLLAMLGVEDEGLVERLTAQWSSATPPAQDLHYLICLSRLPGRRSPAATERTAEGLVGVQPKMLAGNLYVSRHWPQRVGEAVVELYRHDPALPEAVVAAEGFKLPAHALLARHMPPAMQPAAARKLLAAARADAESRWTDDLVAVAATLPDEEAFDALRAAWGDYSLRDAIVAVLARTPQATDRARFLEALGSVQATTVQQAAAALEKLGGTADEPALVAVFAALKQSCLVPEQAPLRQGLVKLLALWTGQTIAVNDPGQGEVAGLYRPWFEWLAAAHPAAAAKLAASTSTDAAAWQERLARIEKLESDAVRGRLVFERKACLKCHAGNSPLGPDLAGAAARLAGPDLLAAIIDPSKDVSPLYQTTQVVTGSGRVVTGLVVYESPDGTLIQTDPDNTVRVAGDEIVAMRKSRVSLMPSGLLNDVSDQEIADLFAYLKSLAPAGKSAAGP